MDKKKIFGIIIFIIIGLFMFSFANPNEEVKLYDCGDEDASNQEEVTACVQEKMDKGSTEKKALSSCRKTYCNVTNDDKDNTSLKEDTTSNTNEVVNTQENNNELTETTTVENINETNPIENNNQTSNENQSNMGSTGNETVDNTVNELNSLKEQATQELKKYYEGLKFDNEFQKQAKNILENGINNINESKSKEEVLKALEDAKQKLNNLLEKQELENYKKNAVNDIKDYANNLELKETKDEIIENARKEIEKATNKEEIDKIVDKTKEELKDLKGQENLALAKEKAIQELKNYRVDYKYNENNQKVYEELLNEYIEKINLSETLEDVSNFLELGKEEIDKLINEDLNSYKQKAINEINNYVDLNNYREEQQEEIKNIIEESTKNINESLTKEEIDKIVESTKKALDEVKTNEELTIEETRYVTFVDYNGKVIEKQPVKIGESAIAPSISPSYTSRYITYTFTNWDKDFTNVVEDITVTALYDITAIQANIYVLKEGNTKPANGESLGANAYEHLSTVSLNVTEELKDVIKTNKTVTISLDQDTILSYVSSTMPIASDFHYYDYYVIKFEKNDGFHIDCELVFDSVAFEEYKKLAIEEIKDYSNSLNLSGDNKDKANEIIDNAVNNINNATTKEEIDSIKEQAKKELNDILSSIKESAIKEVEDAINNASFTGSYVDKANSILEDAKNEINNANNEIDINNLKDKYLNEVNALIELSKKTFVADINTKNIFKLKKLSITDIASDVIISKISYVYPFGFVDTKYVNSEYHSSILLDEEINDLLFGATLVKIEYTKDNVKYINTYDIQRNILSSITGLKLVSTDLVK